MSEMLKASRSLENVKEIVNAGIPGLLLQLLLEIHKILVEEMVNSLSGTMAIFRG